MNFDRNWSLHSLNLAPSSKTLVEIEIGAAMYKITIERTLSTKTSIALPMLNSTTPPASQENKNGNSEITIFADTALVE